MKSKTTENGNTTKNFVIRSPMWQIAVLILPIIFAVAGMVAIYYDPDSRLFIVGLGVSLIFGFTLSTLTRFVEASDNAASEAVINKVALENISTKLEEIKTQSVIAQSLSDRRLVVNANGLLDGIIRTAEIAERFPSIAPFCDWKISQIEGLVRDLGKQAEDGKVVIDDPARELTSSSELLRSSGTQEVLAISYEDTPFWTSNEGQRFLDEHKNAITRNVNITRIFIVDSDDEKELLPIMKAQNDLGVTVYRVSANDVRDLSPTDVVIYDKILIRMGYNEDYTTSNKFKAAQLIVSPEVIRKQLQTFEALKARAEIFVEKVRK